MEKESSGLRNLLGIYSPTYAPDDPSMNVSVHSSNTNTPLLSPYLSVNPYAIQEPEFILPEGASRQRGRLEYAFGAIGGSVILGAGVGGLSGLYRGLQDTQGQPAKIRRTQLINYVVKRGATTGNALGVMALMYSGFGVFLNWIREEDDDLNTIGAATATGLLYKSSAGLRRCGIGGLVGAGIASAYVLWTKANNNRSIASMIGSRRF
jgi:import inner membrane translocase subunit TIM23